MTSTGKMFQASSSDVSDFTDVALSFVNTLTEHKEILKSETVGGQNNPCCVNPTHRRIQRWSFVGKHERVQSIVLCSPTRSKSCQTPIQGENGVSFSAQ